MENQIVKIALSLLVSVFIVSYSLPKIMLFSLKKKFLDNVDSRKIHTTTASRLGGAAFFPAIVLSLISVVAFEMAIGNEGNFAIDSRTLVELGCIMLLYIIGLVDDALNVKYKTKFHFQFFTALAIISTGNFIQGLNGFMGIDQIDYFISIPFTVILFVFITNAINLIDGIDGLASIISIMALGAYGTMFFLNIDYINSIICFATMAALIPFFYCNVFGIRKKIKSKIFMGDGGALVIGFILACMSVKLWNMPYLGLNEQKNIADLSWIISFTMLLIPCFDVVRVVLHRAKIKEPLFLPDKNHFHHKLISFGLNAHETLCMIVMINVVYLFSNLTLYKYNIPVTAIILFDIASWTLLHLYLTHKIKYNKNQDA